MGPCPPPPDRVWIVCPCQKIVHPVSIFICCKVAVDTSSVLSKRVLALPVSNSERLGTWLALANEVQAEAFNRRQEAQPPVSSLTVREVRAGRGWGCPAVPWSHTCPGAAVDFAWGKKKSLFQSTEVGRVFLCVCVCFNCNKIWPMQQYWHSSIMWLKHRSFHQPCWSEIIHFYFYLFLYFILFCLLSF